MVVHEERGETCFLGDERKLAMSSGSDIHAFLINGVHDILSRTGGKNRKTALSPLKLVGQADRHKQLLHYPRVVLCLFQSVGINLSHLLHFINETIQILSCSTNMYLGASPRLNIPEMFLLL